MTIQHLDATLRDHGLYTAVHGNAIALTDCNGTEYDRVFLDGSGKFTDGITALTLCEWLGYETKEDLK